MMDSSISSPYDPDYSAARTKALFHSVLARLAGRPNRLLSFEAVKDKLGLRGSVYRGIQAVPVKAIIGSVDRYRDFDHAFLPAQTFTADRWKSINRAFYSDTELPPVKLYKVGDAYFVLDGHHRVSVAREHKVEYIDAEVIEVRSRVPITPEVKADDLEILGEYDSFLERTELDRLRPEQSIRFTIAGGHERLLEHIAVHRYFMGVDEQRDISEAEAVTHWYDTVYLPVIEVIRQQNVLKDFPGRTESDLYVWLIDHLHYLRESQENVDPAQAAHEFAEEFSERPVQKLLRTVAQAIDAIGEAEAPLTEPAADTKPGEPVVDSDQSAGE
jgi:hypothetical protein